MLRLAKAFWDIAVGRKSPEHLPASAFLLWLVIMVAASLEAIDGLLPPHPSRRLLLRVLVEVGFPVVFAWCVLRVARRPQRFLQTASALLGVQVLLGALIIYPTEWLMGYVGPDRLAALPFYLVYYAGFIWYLLACASIWRAAFDSALWLGGALSVASFLLSISLEVDLLTEP